MCKLTNLAVNFENFIQSNKPVTKINKAFKKNNFDVLCFTFSNTQHHLINLEEHLVIKK